MMSHGEQDGSRAGVAGGGSVSVGVNGAFHDGVGRVGVAGPDCVTGADGEANYVIADRVGVWRPTVNL